MSERLKENSEMQRRSLYRVFVAMVIIGGGGGAMVGALTGNWVSALLGGIITAYGILLWRQGQKPSARIEWGIKISAILVVVLVIAQWFSPW